MREIGIKALIGDYEAFFSDLLTRLSRIDILVNKFPISHLTYRVETITEYLDLRDQLKKYCGKYVETQFNGRAVAILVLETPLKLCDGFAISMIELPAPRPVHMYPTGLESVGILVGKGLSDFMEKHKAKMTGIKDHGVYCQPPFITFENEKTAKFYDISLEEIIYHQGWKLENLSHEFLI